MMTDTQNHQHLLNKLGTVYTPDEGHAWLDRLIQDIDWQYDYLAFGRRFTVPRLQAWYADEGIHYRYADNLLQRKDWNTSLLSLRDFVEQKTQHHFNAVLVTYYRDGNDCVDWHADNEAELGDQPVIASLSFGAVREFQYRHNDSGDCYSIYPEHGELLLMQPDFQHDWQHCVPPAIPSTAPRINLTFRHVLQTRDTN